MKLKVEHVTTFRYDRPVYETATEVRLQPRSDAGSPQAVLDFVLQLKPPSIIEYYMDFYGNNVHHFNLLQSHRQIEIRAVSIVETISGYTPARPNEEIMRVDFLNESRYIKFDPQIQALAAQFDPHQDNRVLAEEVCRQVNQTFKYDKGVTDVHSTTTEVMALGGGVCQDFAHIVIAVCRCLNIPTRYVSGYLYTDGGSGASHAWCEVFCGPPLNSWVAFDATHSKLLIDERYIKIGIGRDYNDIPPVRGTFRGGADEKLEVAVTVSDVSETKNAL